MQLSFTIYVAERERGGEGREYLAQAAVIYSYKMKYSKLTLLERSVLRTRKELKSMPKTSWAFFTLSEWKEWMFLFDISPGFTCVIGHFQPCSLQPVLSGECTPSQAGVLTDTERHLSCLVSPVEMQSCRLPALHRARLVGTAADTASLPPVSEKESPDWAQYLYFSQ